MNFESSVLQVAVEDIIPNRFQPRLVFEDNSLQELSDSIKQHGIIQPLVLRKVGDKYEIIAGERRYKAATMAGLATVPAVISQADDKTSAEAAIVENVQRKDLSAIEEAKSYKALLDQGYMSQEQLARKMGLSQSAISNKLRLLTLPEEIQKNVMENKISERHARSLLKIKDTDEQLSLMNRIIKERLTVRQLDEIIKEAHPNGVQNINIEEVREKSEDIKPTEVEAPIEEKVETDPFKKGAINLGQRQQNRFFNTLEAEAANMQMTEAINPFDGFENNDSPFSGTTTVDTKVNKAEKIEEQKNIQFSSTPEQVLGGPIDVNNIPNSQDEDNSDNSQNSTAMDLSPSQLSNEPQDIYPKETAKDLSTMMNVGVSPVDIPKTNDTIRVNETTDPVNSFSAIFKGAKPEESEELTQVSKESDAVQNDMNLFQEPKEMEKIEPTDLIVEPQPESMPPQEEVEMLDTLDFEPPKKAVDVTPIENRINEVITELKNQNLPIDFVKTDLVDQVTFTISIKKEI